LERDPNAVLDDVLDEFITLDVARETYGVIIDPQSMLIDVSASEQLRLAGASSAN
jgi:N-methylhydantoinase B